MPFKGNFIEKLKFPNEASDRASVLSNVENNGQPRNPPQPFQYVQQNSTNHSARAVTRSLSNSEPNVSQGQK